MSYLAIHQQNLIAKGSLVEIVKRVKNLDKTLEPIVIKVDTCERIDFSWHGTEQQVLENLPTEGPVKTAARGRPKLGVVSKEVTLLPRHWQWLATQRGGASATLRRLVEEAQKNPSIEERIQLKQQELDQFMLIFLADEPGYEEASRALYRNSRVSFIASIASWPADIQEFVLEKFTEIENLHVGNP